MQKFLFFLVLFIIIPSTVFSDEPDKILHEKCLYPTVAVALDVAGHTCNRGTGTIIRSEKIDDAYGCLTEKVKGKCFKSDFRRERT